MWSAIGRAAARQLRVGGRLPIRCASRLAVHAHVAGQATAAVPSGFWVAAVFQRGYAETRGRPRKTDTPTKTRARAATKAPAKKKATAKKRAAAKKSAAQKLAEKKKKKKAEMTAEEIAEEKRKLRIKELRKMAALKPPTKLPDSAWQIYMNQAVKEKLKGKQTLEPHASLIGAVRDLAESYKTLPAAEVAKLQAQARENKLANEVALKAWIESHTPQEIYDANRARATLRREYNIHAGQALPDPRIPTRPGNAFSLFVKSRWASIEAAGPSSLPEQLATLSDEWKKLGDAERQPFHDEAHAHMEEWKRQKDAIGIGSRGRRRDASE